jgi:hypothetical protein
MIDAALREAIRQRADDRYEEATIQGVTPTGRVTVYVLNMNEDNRLRLRYRLLENHELD